MPRAGSTGLLALALGAAVAAALLARRRLRDVGDPAGNGSARAETPQLRRRIGLARARSRGTDLEPAG